jgi:DNA-binding NarL/FixJ family response regulator
MRTTQRPSVLLADDHMIVVQGLQKLLEPYFEIAGSVQDGRELVGAALNTNPM